MKNGEIMDKAMSELHSLEKAANEMWDNENDKKRVRDALARIFWEFHNRMKELNRDKCVKAQLN